MEQRIARITRENSPTERSLDQARNRWNEIYPQNKRIRGSAEEKQTIFLYKRKRRTFSTRYVHMNFKHRRSMLVPVEIFFVSVYQLLMD